MNVCSSTKDARGIRTSHEEDGGYIGIGDGSTKRGLQITSYGGREGVDGVGGGRARGEGEDGRRHGGCLAGDGRLCGTS